MRWKPNGRAGIVDDRWKNSAPPKAERKGTVWEDAPVNDYEYRDKRIADHERDNYLRRTQGLPELPLPPDLKPVDLPGYDVPQVANGPLPATRDENGNTLGVDGRPNAASWSVSVGPTNPVVDSFFSEKLLRKYHDSLRHKLSGQLPPVTTRTPVEAVMLDRLKTVHAAHDKPINEELRTVGRVQSSKLLQRIEKLRAIRNKPNAE